MPPHIRTIARTRRFKRIGALTDLAIRAAIEHHPLEYLDIAFDAEGPKQPWRRRDVPDGMPTAEYRRSWRPATAPNPEPSRATTTRQQSCERPVPRASRSAPTFARLPVNHRHLRLSTVVLALAACAGPRLAPTASPDTAPASGTGDPGYTAYVSGSTTDAVTTPTGGALLAGGGTDSDAAMRWLLVQGGTRGTGQYGDVVVLRASGSDGYNKFLMDLGANSVTSIVIRSVAGANSAYVRNAIGLAEVVFLAGGDQSKYVTLWTGTALQAAVNARVAARYPIGGTSAGLAVIGEHAYSALTTSSTSAVALANPYDSSVTFARSLFTVPLLANLITDSHFVTRNRLGRTLTFLARLQQDKVATSPRGIAVDEGSALGVTASGAGTVFGKGEGVYFFSIGEPVTRIVLPKTMLTFSPVITYHVPVGQQFNVMSWTTADATPYTLRVTAGALSSSKGTIY